MKNIRSFPFGHTRAWLQVLAVLGTLIAQGTAEGSSSALAPSGPVEARVKAVAGLQGAQTPSVSARDLAERWASNKGWTSGRTASGLPYFITSSSIAGKVKDPSYVRASESAFESAINAARQEASRFLDAEVETRLSQKQQLAEIVGDPEFAEAITGTASDAAFAESEERRSLVTVVSRALMAGFTTVQTFVSVDAEGQAELAVITSISAKTLSALGCGTIDGDARRSPIKEWVDGISPSELARTYGTRMRCNEQGVRVPVCFIRVPVSDKPLLNDGALSSAETRAMGELANLVAQAVTCAALQGSLSTRESGTGMPDRFRNVQAFREQVEVSSKTALRGAQAVSRRKVIDPDSGVEVYVVAVQLDRCTGGPSGETARPEKEPCAGCPDVPANLVERLRKVCATGVGPNIVAATKSALLEVVSRDGAMVEGDSVQQRQYQEALRKFGETLETSLEATLTQSQSVKTMASGFVYSFQETGRQDKDGLVEVSICANLLRFDPKDPRFGAPPTLAVFVDSSSRIKTKGVPDPDATIEGIRRAIGGAESALRGCDRYMLIDEGIAPDLRRYRGLIVDRVQRGESPVFEALKIGQQLSADYLLVVDIQAEFTGQGGLAPKIGAGDAARAKVGARMINVATGEVTWTGTAETPTLNGNQLLTARAGKDAANPQDRNLAPIDIVCNRATAALKSTMQAELCKGQSSHSSNSTPLVVVRVVGKSVTLTGGDGSVRVGTRLKVIKPVAVTLPGGKIAIDRDEVAQLVVTSVGPDLIKANTVEGDADLIDPKNIEIEVVNATR